MTAPGHRFRTTSNFYNPAPAAFAMMTPWPIQRTPIARLPPSRGARCGAELVFVKTAFGGVETSCQRNPDGTVTHGEITIGDSLVSGHLTHELLKRGRCRRARASERTSRTDIEMPESSIGTASRGPEPRRESDRNVDAAPIAAWGDPAAAGEKAVSIPHDPPFLLLIEHEDLRAPRPKPCYWTPEAGSSRAPASTSRNRGDSPGA